jgi:endonuclease G, mitochondrial
LGYLSEFLATWRRARAVAALLHGVFHLYAAALLSAVELIPVCVVAQKARQGGHSLLFGLTIPTFTPQQRKQAMPYNPDFLGRQVKLPVLTKDQIADTLVITEGETSHTLIPHEQYSVALSKSRRLAWYSAAHFDALLKKDLKREDLRKTFKVEETIEKEQIVDKNWYKTTGATFDQGHLTPADVMEWGENKEAAKRNANDTFYFSNASPQHKNLNRNAWKLLEFYISEQGIKTGSTRLTVFTGNVLLPNDPTYKHDKPEHQIKIPQYFWKVVYYLNSKKKICRICFLMGQKDLLIDCDLVEQIQEKDTKSLGDPFKDLGKNKTYQVSMSLIQQLTQHKFQAAMDDYQEERPIEILMEEVDIDPKEKNLDMEVVKIGDKFIALRGIKLGLLA